MAKRTTVRLVPPLQAQLIALAKEIGGSYNQLVNYALARFVEAQQGVAVLEERARRGSRPGFLNVLAKADRRKREPETGDVLPASYRRQALKTKLRQEKNRAA
ncbi:MAG: hypothetical protein ACRD2L_08495 [Terriglobia bacterium]